MSTPSYSCGARILWAALALAAGLAYLRRLGGPATACLALAAALIALLGNVLRVAGLFYLEIVAESTSRFTHDGTGLAAFALVVAATLLVAHAIDAHAGEKVGPVSSPP